MLPRCILASALVAVSAFLLAGARQPVHETGPLVELSGSYSQVTKPRVQVIGDPAGWEATWKEHRGASIEKDATGRDVVPYVDFSRCMVVAMFSGRTSNGAGLHVVSVQERGGHTLIRYDRSSFQSEVPDGGKDPFECADYGFATIERTPLPIVLELNTQTMLDAGPIWKEQQRLPALPKPAKPTGPRPVR